MDYTEEEEEKELACIICTDNSCSRNSKFAFVPNDHLALCSDSLCIARRAKKWMVKAGYRKIDPEVAELKSKIAVLEERIQGYEGVLTAIKQGDRQGEVKLFKFNGRYYAAYIVVA